MLCRMNCKDLVGLEKSKRNKRSSESIVVFQREV